MDFNIISEAISTLGFPIVMVGAFGWYINKKDKERLALDAEMRERNNKEWNMLIDYVEKNRFISEKLLSTNEELAESNRLLINEFSSKINNIENNIIEIKHKINK